MSTYYLENFGCRATQADGAAIERDLLEGGHERAPTAGEAALIVLNSCTVTASADQDVRAAIRRVHRENPGARILVTGCYAQRAPEELAAIEGVTWVVGNSHKAEVAEIVERRDCAAGEAASFVPVGALGAQVIVGDIFAHTELRAAPVFDATGYEQTRPNLKVQDGCDNRCSFCIIPSVRGQSRSLAPAEVIRQVEKLVAAGYREVVISGINLGRWGRDLRPERRFEDLVRAILERTTLEKLRLSSIEPMDWSDELIEMMAGCRRIARHVHAPLQSGSDRILRLMHRKYRPWHYEGRIRRARQRMPDAAIGADVMTGFPGETDADFEESRRFIASFPFTYLHVFTYSSRPGTASAEMPGQVPAPVARERNRILRELAAEKNLAFRRSFAGRRLQAITLDVRSSERTKALTDNYLKLELAGDHAPNQWLSAEITGVSEHGLVGRVAV